MDRAVAGELRFAGRTLSGVVLPYGEVSPEFRERFEPGAFQPLPLQGVPLNLMHDPAAVVAEPGTYTLTDGPAALELRATIDPGSAAAQMIRAGHLGAFSVEFLAFREAMDGDVRVIQEARLGGIALVDDPGYPGAAAELRRRGGGGRGSRGGRLASFRGRIPAGKLLECRCGPKGCGNALIRSGALDGVLSARRQRDVLAVVGDYRNAIGSKDRDSLRFWSDGEGGLNVAVDIPNNAVGQRFMETAAQVPTIARPVIDDLSAVSVRRGATVEYAKADIRAVTVGPTDATRGWEPMRKLTDGDPGFDGTPGTRRRSRTWL